MVYNLCYKIFDNSENIKDCLINYFNDDIINQLYFVPKKIDKKSIIDKINDNNYINKVFLIASSKLFEL